MRLLFCGTGWRSLVDVLNSRLEGRGRVTLWDHQTPLPEAARDVDVLLPSNAPVGAETIAAARALRLIQQPAAGTDGIDVAAAAARGIPVCNAPGANPVSVAEAALHLMLAVARRVPEARAAFETGIPGQPVGMELAGKTLGVVGAGQSGSALLRIAAGLGMETRSIASQSTDAEFDCLLRDSDVISLHCPLTRATRGLFDDDVFARMKPGAILINCARGPVVDRAALTNALSSGRLGGVGLDTFWEEPWDPSDPLFDRPDVVMMPHTAGSTRESFSRIAGIVCENLHRIIRGEPPLHQVSQSPAP